MAKKIYIRLIWFVLLEIALVVCALCFRTLNEGWLAFLFLLAAACFLGKPAKLLCNWYFYRELCSELKSIGENPAHQAIEIFRLKSAALWEQYAPETEKERFEAYLKQMSKNTAGYDELKYLVEHSKT